MIKNETQFLEISKFAALPRLAMQLPCDLAYRYHALPVAKEGECITVAMADPNDQMAREAISAALGTSTYVIQADTKVIDDLLDELWSERLETTRKFLAWLPATPIDLAGKTYSQNLANLLGAKLLHFETPKSGRGAYKSLAEQSERNGADLVIFRAPQESLLKRLFGTSDERVIIDSLCVSSLLVHGCQWPIRKILLVIRNDESDKISFEWALNLAKSSDASVTVLPITIPLPDIYRPEQPDIALLMTADTPLGQKIRYIARRFADWEIRGKICQHYGSPEDQIRRETLIGNYDLIIIGEEPKNWIRCRIYGDLIGPLLALADRPILIAKPQIEPQEQEVELR